MVERVHVLEVAVDDFRHRDAVDGWCGRGFPHACVHPSIHCCRRLFHPTTSEFVHVDGRGCVSSWLVRHCRLSHARAKRLFHAHRYRTQFTSPTASEDDDSAALLLHFGAVDWQTTVYLNGVELGNHTGGYDGFDFDITQRTCCSVAFGCFGRQPEFGVLCGTRFTYQRAGWLVGWMDG